MDNNRFLVGKAFFLRHVLLADWITNYTDTALCEFQMLSADAVADDDDDGGGQLLYYDNNNNIEAED